jgi:hypothetical protein
MILEAGGIDKYMHLPDSERSILMAKYGMQTETIDDPSNVGPKSSETGSDGPVLAAPGIVGGPPPAEGLACVPFLDASVRNKEFTISPHKYATDPQGRPTYGLARFTGGQISENYRNACSGTVGSWGAPPPGTPMPTNGYEGGHVIGNSLGGIPQRINLTPQAYYINRSTFPKIEAGVRYCARQTQWATSYMVIPYYNNSSVVTPDSYQVWVTIRRPLEQSAPGAVGFLPFAAEFRNWTGNVPAVPQIYASASGNLEQINFGVDLFVQQMRDQCSRP